MCEKNGTKAKHYVLERRQKQNSKGKQKGIEQVQLLENQASRGRQCITDEF